MATCKTLDWNHMSELGLIEQINTQILHPIGLAMSRNPETGSSDQILISDDGKWEYDPKIESSILSAYDLGKKLALMISQSALKIAMPEKTLKQLQETHANWLKSVNWFKDKLPLESLFLMNEELVEVGREFRQKVVDKERVADELADVVLRTMGLAAEQDIDLQMAIIRKIEVNLKRGTRGRVK